RNAPTSLMKKLGYGQNYMYAHDYPGNFVRQQFRPDELSDTVFWHPGQNQAEDAMRSRQEARWGK
ncbi:MAG: replication-associated recombination protein A, partial [Muribaculaceae bacterium]|nr:replication-associated recombination protein A [Muribaculaceae bacterium]